VVSLFDLGGKVALVTGGNGGIGLGMAKGLAFAGASIAIAGRNTSKATAALGELKAAGAKADFIALDVVKEQSCREAVKTCVERFGRIDILVNNSGTTVRKQPEDISADDWHLVIETNLTGALYCCQAAYPHFVKGGGGKIINNRFDDVAVRRRLCRALRGEQRRHRAAQQVAGDRLGQG